MKKKWKANAYYMGAMLLGVAALLCAAGIENSTNGWAMLGLVTEQQPDENQKVHQPPRKALGERKVG